MKTKTSTAWLTTLLLAFALSGTAQQWERITELPTEPFTALFALGDTLFAAGKNTIYYTADGGGQWYSTAVIDPELDYISALHFSPNRWYVGSIVKGMYRSTDGGKSWQPDNQGLTGLGSLNISSLASRGDSLYVGTYGAKIFVKKISANSAWSPYAAGLPWFNVESITNIGGTLYAGSGGNATVSRQAYPGHTWEELPFAVFGGALNSFLAAVQQGEVLLAAGTLGLYRSMDQGNTWTPYNPGTGVLGSARFTLAGQRVIANLAKPAAISFIKYTDNQGLSWHDFNPPLTGSYGFDLLYWKGQLFSAREDGLWRIGLATPVQEPQSAIAALGQNYPNPFSGTTHIPLHLNQQTWIELAVFDAQGRLVRQLWRGELPAGRHQFDFDAASLPAGLYFCRLSAGTTMQTRRILVGG